MNFQCNRGDLQVISKMAAESIKHSSVEVYPRGVDYPDLMSEPGIYFQTVDESNTFEMTAAIEESFFSSAEFPEAMEMGIPWVDFNRVIDSRSESEVFVELNEETRKLHFETDSGFDFNMSLISTDTLTGGGVPELDYNSVFECTVEDIARVLSSCELVGKDVHFQIEETDNGRRAVGWSEGDTNDTRDTIRELPNADIPLASSQFSIDIVKYVTQPMPKDSRVEFRMLSKDDKNYPVQLELTPFEGVKVQTTFAPRNSS